MHLDCAIIGGGPAGLTAATYLRRFHRKVVVFDDGQSRVRWIPASHNCPGFPTGVSGPVLLDRLRDQAREYEVPIAATRILRLQRGEDHWWLADGEREWTADAVLLASGVEDRMPRVDRGDLEDAIGRGLIRLCAICDGYEATDARIAVLGPLERALPHARFLRTYSSRICAIPHDDTDADAPSSQEDTGPGITVLPPLAALHCDGDECEVVDQCGGVHRFDTLYPVLGAAVRSGLAAQAGAAMGANGEILTDEHLRTSLPGLYAAGDVVTDINQISVAFGHAAIAATAIHRVLASNFRGPPLAR